MDRYEAKRYIDTAVYHQGWRIWCASDVDSFFEVGNHEDIAVRVNYRAIESNPGSARYGQEFNARTMFAVRKADYESEKTLQDAIMAACLVIHDHEARESLKFAGKAEFHPHTEDGTNRHKNEDFRMRLKAYMDETDATFGMLTQMSGRKTPRTWHGEERAA